MEPHRAALRPDDQGASHTRALIVHPMSMFAGAKSSTYGADWHLAAFLFQRLEMQQLIKQRQEQNVTEHEQPRRLCLLDYTCDENLKAIFGFLDGPSLCAARRVCRQFHELGSNDEFWLHLCIAEWAISPDQLRQRPESYQSLYKFACQSLQKLIREFFQEQCLTSMQTSFRIPRDAALMIARRSFV